MEVGMWIVIWTFFAIGVITTAYIVLQWFLLAFRTRRDRYHAVSQAYDEHHAERARLTRERLKLMRDKESEIEDDKAAQRIIEMRDKHKKEQQKSLPQVQSTMPIKTNRITFRRGQVDEGKNDS